MKGGLGVMKEIVWWNGTFCPIESVRISPLDRGFLYGDGLFETIRLQKGKPLWLSEHLDRLKKSLSFFNIKSVGEFFDMEKAGEIIDELCRKNPHLGEVARLKIIVTRGTNPTLGLPELRFVDNTLRHGPTVLFMATPYTPPSEADYNRGWTAKILHGRYSPPLGAHKTLNYLFFLWAKEQARSDGFHEAIIEDLNGHIAEASTASLLVFINGVWIFPQSQWKLPGVTEGIIARFLEEDGEKTEIRPVYKWGLLQADVVWLLNSMVGIMPVCRIDDHVMPNLMAKYASELRKRLFSG
jgi:branched-subunit amino acid aminotransferase/4-amino-4-deoxychorismate lyase